MRKSSASPQWALTLSIAVIVVATFLLVVLPLVHGLLAPLAR
jgi:hypothetical protein